MSFAGQLVVESHFAHECDFVQLPFQHAGKYGRSRSQSFDEAIDAKLKEADPQIPLAQLTVRDVISKIMAGEYRPYFKPEENAIAQIFEEKLHLGTIQRILIHARGCTATRLINAAHEAGLEVVLVQSDPDMDSYPAIY